MSRRPSSTRNLLGCTLSFELKQNKIETPNSAVIGKVNVWSSTAATLTQISIGEDLPPPGLDFTKYEVLLSPDEVWMDCSSLPSPGIAEAGTAQAILKNTDYHAILG